MEKIETEEIVEEAERKAKLRKQEKRKGSPRFWLIWLILSTLSFGVPLYFAKQADWQNQILNIIVCAAPIIITCLFVYFIFNFPPSKPKVDEIVQEIPDIFEEVGHQLEKEKERLEEERIVWEIEMKKNREDIKKLNLLRPYFGLKKEP